MKVNPVGAIVSKTIKTDIAYLKCKASSLILDAWVSWHNIREKALVLTYSENNSHVV